MIYADNTIYVNMLYCIIYSFFNVSWIIKINVFCILNSYLFIIRCLSALFILKIKVCKLSYFLKKSYKTNIRKLFTIPENNSKDSAKSYQ